MSQSCSCDGPVEVRGSGDAEFCDDTISSQSLGDGKTGQMEWPPSSRRKTATPVPKDLPSLQQLQMASKASQVDGCEPLNDKFVSHPPKLLQQSKTLAEVVAVPSLFVPSHPQDRRHSNTFFSECSTQASAGMLDAPIQLPYDGHMIGFAHNPVLSITWSHAIFKRAPLKKRTLMNYVQFEGSCPSPVEKQTRSREAMCACLVLQYTQICNCMQHCTEAASGLLADRPSQHDDQTTVRATSEQPVNRSRSAPVSLMTRRLA